MGTPRIKEPAKSTAHPIKIAFMLSFITAPNLLKRWMHHHFERF
jgi:hypothetical protein